MRATADPSVELLIEGDALCEPLERAGSQERAASGGCTDRTRATGRTHQIRVHMKHIGHALLGDKVYLPDRSKHARPDREELSSTGGMHSVTRLRPVAATAYVHGTRWFPAYRIGSGQSGDWPQPTRAFLLMHGATLG